MKKGMKKIEPPSEEEKKQDRAFWKFLFFFFLIYFIVTRFIQPLRTAGPSMSPTYQDGDIVICNKTIKEYTYDDILVIKYKPEGSFLAKNIIKRVVAVPGDTVYAINGELYINDVKEDNNFPIMEDVGLLENPITLKEGEYFVLGDNRNFSSDSRVIGPISSNILGKVIKSYRISQ